MIPRAITRELAKLVRSRDTWRRRALDRAAGTSTLHRVEEYWRHVIQSQNRSGDEDRLLR